jgi:hypothetical protein
MQSLALPENNQVTGMQQDRQVSSVEKRIISMIQYVSLHNGDLLLNMVLAHETHPRL